MRRSSRAWNRSRWPGCAGWRRASGFPARTIRPCWTRRRSALQRGLQGGSQRGVAADQVGPGQLQPLALALGHQLQALGADGEGVQLVADGQFATDGLVQWGHARLLLTDGAQHGWREVALAWKTRGRSRLHETKHGSGAQPLSGTRGHSPATGTARSGVHLAATGGGLLRGLLPAPASRARIGGGPATAW